MPHRLPVRRQSLWLLSIWHSIPKWGQSASWYFVWK